MLAEVVPSPQSIVPVYVPLVTYGSVIVLLYDVPALQVDANGRVAGGDGEIVGVILGVGVLVGVILGVGVIVGVIVFDGERVGVTVLVGVLVGVTVLVGVIVGVIVGVMVGVIVLVGVTVGVMVGVTVGVGVIVGVGVGVGQSGHPFPSAKHSVPFKIQLFGLESLTGIPEPLKLITLKHLG